MRKYRLQIGLDVDDILYDCNAFALERLNREEGIEPPCVFMMFAAGAREFVRSHHKLTEWHTLCDWILSLPYAADQIAVKE